MSTTKEVLVPDIGNVADVDVIEILVAKGDIVDVDTALITLESDKASMEVPSSSAGKVKEIKVKIGDKVSKGSVILILEQAAVEKKPEPTTVPVEKKEQPSKAAVAAEPQLAKTETKPQPPVLQPIATSSSTLVYAGPAVRRFARELGADLTRVKGSGRKERITKDDVVAFVKTQLQQSVSTGGGLPFPPAPLIDFNQFGEIETKALSKIKKISAVNLHRNWVMIPHVTQFDQADITDLEVFRQTNRIQAEKQGFKLTPLAFIMKATVAALKHFPQFNSSLASNGEQLILKKYYHLGVAVDSPNGLVVPVIRDVDKKGVFDLAKELAEISEKARSKGLTVTEMQGSSFTISSLGGISGTAFTPIINAPDVAILGVSKSEMKPVYQNGAFVPRLMLPLSLSYDHRVIDGAEAARFTQFLAQMLADLRNILL